MVSEKSEREDEAMRELNGKILIVDDDMKINDLLVDIFDLENYETVSAYNGQEALDILEKDRQFDLMILDAAMPVLDGWDILKYVRENYSIKIIMLTALNSEADEVRGLREGADDYISKPFSRAVLLERVRKLINDSYIQKNVSYRCDGLVVDQSLFQVSIDGERVSMTNKEYQLLLLLMSNANMVMSRDLITQKIWGFENDVEVRNVDTQIKMLRRSIGSYGERIHTVRGVGYYFDGEVRKE